MTTEDIQVGGSGSGQDLVSAREGDFMLHDDVRTWLPYPKQATGGAFQTAAADSSAVYHANAKAYSWKGYDGIGRLTSKGIPGCPREFYKYDEEDRLIGITRGDERFDMSYDAFGRLTQKTCKATPDATAVLLEEHVYDARPAAAETLLNPDPMGEKYYDISPYAGSTT